MFGTWGRDAQTAKGIMPTNCEETRTRSLISRVRLRWERDAVSYSTSIVRSLPASRFRVIYRRYHSYSSATYGSGYHPLRSQGRSFWSGEDCILWRGEIESIYFPDAKTKTSAGIECPKHNFSHYPVINRERLPHHTVITNKAASKF